MYLVTGGAGFIGSHLVARLLDRGGAVRVFDNFSTGKEENLAAFGFRAEVVRGDLRDLAAVRAAMEDIEVVFHQAADPSVPRSMTDPAACYEANVMGTLNILQAAREVGVRRVVFASSCAVYGDDPRLPKTERTRPAPASPYASSKLAGEQLCEVYTRSFGLEAVALRYFNVFGPRQDPGSAYAPVIPRFIQALLATERPMIFGDGNQTRDFIYVDDVVQANLLAAESPDAPGRVFNIASGRSVSLNRLLATLGEIIGTGFQPVYLPARPGDVRHSAAEISAAADALGFEILVPLEIGLARTVTAMAPPALVGAA
jgi:nucleoside-diphosphate-sugar epimerase